MCERIPPPSRLPSQHLSPSPRAEHIKAVILLERGEQTSPSHLERGLAVPTPPSPSIAPSGLRVFPLPWPHPAAGLGTRQHSWQGLEMGWSCRGLDKLGLLKPPATSTVSLTVPPLPPGRTVPPATALVPATRTPPRRPAP